MNKSAIFHFCSFFRGARSFESSDEAEAGSSKERERERKKERKKERKSNLLLRHRTRHPVTTFRSPIHRRSHWKGSTVRFDPPRVFRPVCIPGEILFRVEGQVNGPIGSDAGHIRSSILNDGRTDGRTDDRPVFSWLLSFFLSFFSRSLALNFSCT